jgi:hypothetical protein
VAGPSEIDQAEVAPAEDAVADAGAYRLVCGQADPPERAFLGCARLDFLEETATTIGRFLKSRANFGLIQTE